MIAIDFYSGSHGHFLEYVVNTYIFKGPKIENIFTDLGTSHLIRQNKPYMNQRIAEARHYSEFDLTTDFDFGKIIRITIDDLIGNICYQINVNCRAGDIPADKKNLMIPKTVRASSAMLRQSYYSKFLFSEHGYPTPKSSDWKIGSADNSFEIPMSSMYNIVDFYKILSELSDFLEQTFVPDVDLYNTWCKFVKLNHGLNSWKKCQSVFEHVVSKKNINFLFETHEEALLNALFTLSFKIHDGPLFELDQWPSNTSDIYNMLEMHLDNLTSINIT
jgi:hypothetical protein